MLSEHGALPSVAYEHVARLLPSSDLPSARLACIEFAAAIDHHIESLKVQSWHTVHQLQRLQHVRALDATVQTSADWQQMQQLAAQLPKLAFISFRGRRTWQQLSSNSTSESGPCQLQNLQAASFEGIVKGLDDIAALAPNLQHLYCAKLIITEPLNAHLPAVTHLGSSQVQVEADGPEEGGQVFASAFPGLEVLYQTPEFTFNVLHSIGFQRVNVMPLRDALAHCTNMRGLRVYGDSTTMYGMLPGQLQHLQYIHRVAVYGVGPAAELKGIGKLWHLQHLWLTFQLPAKKAASQLLQELLQLPQLHSLALPAKLLCSRCCAGMQQHVEQLAAKSSIIQLVFLQRPSDDSRRKQSGDYCPHLETVLESFSKLSAQHHAPAVDGSNSSGVAQQQKQLELLQLELNEPVEESARVSAVAQQFCCMAGDEHSRQSGLWGMLGPPGAESLLGCW